jgi:hypothetical protein
VYLENLLLELGKCESCVVKEKSYYSTRCRDEYDYSKCKLSLEELEEREAHDRVWRQIEEMERDRRLVQEGMMWLRDCYVEELRELIEQEPTRSCTT